jgi:hypothetical protein
MFIPSGDVCCDNGRRYSDLCRETTLIRLNNLLLKMPLCKGITAQTTRTIIVEALNTDYFFLFAALKGTEGQKIKRIVGEQ